MVAWRWGALWWGKCLVALATAVFECRHEASCLYGQSEACLALHPAACRGAPRPRPRRRLEGRIRISGERDFAFVYLVLEPCWNPLQTIVTEDTWEAAHSRTRGARARGCSASDGSGRGERVTVSQHWCRNGSVRVGAVASLKGLLLFVEQECGAAAGRTQLNE